METVKKQHKEKKNTTSNQLTAKAFVQQITEYIDHHLQESLNLDLLAQKAGYSKFHLLRCFQEEMGRTIHQYIIEKRLNRAAQQLLNSEETIVNIALEAQYNSQPAFTTAFRQYYHCTPQRYREHFSSNIRCEVKVA